MPWPYHFQTLSSDQVAARRKTLNTYAAYAQASTLLPIALFIVFRIVTWAYGYIVSRGKAMEVDREGGRGWYEEVPGSPALKKGRVSRSGRLQTAWRRAAWWMGGEVRVVVGQGKGWEWEWEMGTRSQWAAGLVYATWLGVLCVKDTGDDYLHLTRRCAAVAMSQFPLHYLLTLKSVSPLAILFRSSHEHIIPLHRVLGRIIYGLLAVHVMLYLNYFIATGVLAAKLQSSSVVQAGVLAFLCLSVLMTTALKPLRRFSYRMFFIAHLCAAFAVPPLAWFHSRHGGLAAYFAAEAIFVFVLDIIARRIDTVTSTTASVERVLGTRLLRITVPVPADRIGRFVSPDVGPGQHVYVSLPSASRPQALLRGLLFEAMFNPFSVADARPASATTGDPGSLTLLARVRDGPMTRQLDALAALNGKDGGVSLCVDGPYGALMSRFEDMVRTVDRVLVVAGGVGATFALPIYRGFLEAGTKATLVWAVRTPEETSWAVSACQEQGVDQNIMADRNVEIFLTGHLATAEQEEHGIKMQWLDPRGQRQIKRQRPDLQKVVDYHFRVGGEDAVAVLVCGPKEMGRELRTAVGGWVAKGRKVWWHEENFAW